MGKEGKAGSLMDQEEVWKHLVETQRGLEKVEFYLDIIDYLLEVRRDWNGLFHLQEELKGLGNSHLQEAVVEIAGDVDIQWFLLQSNIDEIRGCLDALKKKNGAFDFSQPMLRRFLN